MFRTSLVLPMDAKFLYERDLRVVARESSWSRQEERFDNICPKHS
jgi:hypothetical protein